MAVRRRRKAVKLRLPRPTQLFWQLNLVFVILNSASNAVSAIPGNKAETNHNGSVPTMNAVKSAETKELPDIVLRFADRGEIGLIGVIDESALFYGEHPPMNKPRKAVGRVLLPGGSKISFKSRDMMGLLSMAQVLGALPADSVLCLDLSNTLVSDDDLKLVARFHNLRRLDLDNTDISDAGIKHLASLTKLEALNLNKTRCNGSYLSALAGLKNLRFLRIGKSDIDRSVLPNLGAFGKLTCLDVSQVQLRNEDMGVLKCFPDLQKLFIDDNPLLSDKMLPNLVGLKHLDSLSFKNTQITAKGLSKCKALPLEYIRFNAEQISSAGQHEIRANFPKSRLIVEEFKAKALNIYKELTE